MEHIFKTEGTLEVVIGSGILTASDAAGLQSGQIITSQHLAGDPCQVYFNGTPFCRGSIVILDTIFGLRIFSFALKEDADTWFSLPDVWEERIPFSIRLASVSYTMEQLMQLEKGTIISLDVPYREDVDAELVIAGIPAAEGKVVCTYENMGIKLSSL